ncbi:MAG TPA: hypothetical protein VFD71_15870 [Planctomycetota bacterium]|nr:hypothetical protein [Planctomycetota bacterium]
MRFGWKLTVALLPAWLAVGVSASAQDKYNVHFRAARFSGAAGQVVPVAIGLDNQPLAITGFSFGVKHDATKLTLEGVDLGQAVIDAIGAGTQPDDRFYALDQNPVGGPGFTLAIILSADRAAAAIPAGLDHPIATARYRLPPAAAGDTTVTISGDLGNANSKVDIILDANGVAKKPVGAPAPVTTATVAVSAGPSPFVRGDMNQSGRLEVTDAILTLDYLFGGSTLPAGEATRTNCIIAMNFDGSVSRSTPTTEDPEDVDLSDVVALLTYVFRRGVAPPAPFPACGQPTATAGATAECKEFLCH